MKLRFLLLLTALAFSGAQAQTQQWITRYNGAKENIDRGNAVATDASGNIYTGGYSFTKGEGRNAVILKYNASGALQWSTLYNTTSDKTDEVKDIAVDAAGNVYVTGVGNSNYLTLKLNASGTVLWASSYNGLGQDYDEAVDIAIDASGNVYVTGRSDRDEFVNINYDYATVKYNAAGVQQWVSTYNGTGNLDDRANALALDASGNVYVTGQSFNPANEDAVTIKYNTAGVQQWIKIENRGFGDDTGEAIVADASGVYIAGESFNGNDYDYVTYKYDLAGTAAVWSPVFFNDGATDRGVDIALDSGGNIYVTGRSETAAGNFYDITTIKYNSTGVQQWKNVYAYSDGLDDRPSALTVDAAGACYITGRVATAGLTDNLVVLKCNANGTTQVWAQVYNDTGNLDDSGLSVALTGSSVVIAGVGYAGTATQNDILTIKYDAAAGTQQWLQRFNGTGDNTDRPRKLFVDAAGNSYLAGYSLQTGTNRDVMTIKFSPAGSILWSQIYNSLINTDNVDEGFAIIADNSGNVYVAGIADNDYLTLKYNSAGVLQWAQIYNGLGLGFDEALSIGLDPAGNPVVTGRSDRDATAVINYDIVTIKYSAAAGTVLWTATYNGASNGNDRPECMTIDAAGNVYIGGRTIAGATEDALVIKYNNLGVQQWASTYSNIFGNDRINAIEQNNNNVYAAGFVNNGTNDDALLLKYNALGVQQWVKTFIDAGEERFYDMDSDSLQNIYVSGRTYTGSDFDALTAKYSSAGVLKWLSKYNNGPDDSGNDIAVDCAGFVWTTGSSLNGSADDVLILKYNGKNGQQVWSSLYNYTDNLYDQAYDVAVRGSGNTNKIYFTGSSESVAGQGDAFMSLYQETSPLLTITPAGSTVCAGTSLYVQGASLGSFVWKEGSTILATDTVYTIPAAVTGTHTYTVQWTSGMCNTSASKTVTVIPPIQPLVTGGTDVCQNGNYTYSVAPIAGTTYLWTVTGGTIVSGQGTPTITVHWTGSGGQSVTCVQTLP